MVSNCAWDYCFALLHFDVEFENKSMLKIPVCQADRVPIDGFGLLNLSHSENCPDYLYIRAVERYMVRYRQTGICQVCVQFLTEDYVYNI